MNLQKKFLTISLLLLTSTAFPKSEPTETTLPLKFDTGNAAPYGLPSTVITIQGTELPVIFDTGAKKLELALTKKALANIRGVRFTGTQVCSTATSGKHCEDEFIIPEIQIGAFTVKNVKGAVLTKLWGDNNASFKETAASQNGLLGFALLSKFNILLDYPQAKTVLVKPHAKPINYSVDTWIPLPFTGHLLTRLNFDNKPILLSWDTGAIPSAIKKTFAASFQQKRCPTQAPYAKKKECLSVVTTSLTTADGLKKLPTTWFKVIDNIPSIAPFDGLVGSNFYADNLVYFDFDRQTIFIK